MISNSGGAMRVNAQTPALQQLPYGARETDLQVEGIFGLIIILKRLNELGNTVTIGNSSKRQFKTLGQK